MAEFLVVTPGVYASGFFTIRNDDNLFTRLRFFIGSPVASHYLSFGNLPAGRQVLFSKQVASINKKDLLHQVSPLYSQPSIVEIFLFIYISANDILN